MISEIIITFVIVVVAVMLFLLYLYTRFDGTYIILSTPYRIKIKRTDSNAVILPRGNFLHFEEVKYLKRASRMKTSIYYVRLENNAGVLIGDAYYQKVMVVTHPDGTTTYKRGNGSALMCTLPFNLKLPDPLIYPPILTLDGLKWKCHMYDGSDSSILLQKKLF